MSTHRWLLSIGSSLDSDTRVREALACLVDIGACTPLTAIRAFPAHHGHGHYFSALASLAFDDNRDVLDASLKRLENALGRRRDDFGGEVAIDIDILAMADTDAAEWQADAHAVGKGEFRHTDVRTLLDEAGIAVAGTD